jgi:hypothetical protein
MFREPKSIRAARRVVFDQAGVLHQDAPHRVGILSGKKSVVGLEVNRSLSFDIEPPSNLSICFRSIGSWPMDRFHPLDRLGVRITVGRLIVILWDGLKLLLLLEQYLFPKGFCFQRSHFDL